MLRAKIAEIQLYFYENIFLTCSNLIYFTRIKYSYYLC